MKKGKNTLYKSSALCITLTLLLLACNKQATTPLDSQKPPVDPILVKVNQTPITEKDLQLAINKTVGEYAAFNVDEKTSKKILDSLIMSELFAQAQLSTMHQTQIDELQRQVHAYKNQQLTKMYLKDNVQPTPVSDTLVNDYYQKHKKEYQEKSIKSYELIKAHHRVNGEQRKQLMQKLTTLKKQTNWQHAAAALKRAGVDVMFASGAVKEGTLASDVDNIIRQLSAQQTSGIFFINGVPAIARVIKEVPGRVIALEDVSSDIRKQLAPIEFSKAVRSAADALKQQSTIDYQH